MKYINTIRNLVLASFIGASSVATAQDVIKPLHYTSPSANSYKDYVGVRFQVCSPSSIAGDKIYTTSYNTGTTTWGGAPVNFLCKDVVFPTTDTDACSSTAYPSTLFSGKIALIWRGSCEFGCKAQKAQAAGAIACVIVNNVPGGPVGMAAGSCGAGVTIPVYMISLADGTDIANIIRSGGTATMTVIKDWATNINSDLGFVPQGYSISANNATPWKDINANPANGAYAMKPGAFVANYGRNNQTGVKLMAQLSWTPTGGSTSVVHNDTVIKGNFPVTDSIWAMFTPKYNLPTGLTGTGRFDLKYTIVSDSTDGFLGDNTLTYSFYASDSIYSKGRYDFAAGKPVTTLYTAPAASATDPYIWTVPYYVANGGSFAKAIQISFASGATQELPVGDAIPVYLFKWYDTAFGGPDSLYEAIEMELVGTAQYTTVAGDSSFRIHTVEITDSNGVKKPITLSANTWYVLAAEMPSAYSLGLDGVLNGYPRSFGLSKFNNIAEYYDPIWYSGNRKNYIDADGNDVSMWASPNTIFSPFAFPGITSLAGVTGVDSINFDNQKGMIPAIPLITTTHYNAVENVKSVFSKLELYPNPATNSINVAVALDNAASKVTYAVIDATGRSISRESHSNVTNEVYTFNTSNLATGIYYMVITADGRTSTRKFVVAK